MKFMSSFAQAVLLLGPQPRRWLRERVIDGILAVVYVAGCAALAWAGSALR